MSKKGPFSNAKWICCDKGCESPIIIRNFFLEDFKSAVLNITGLGYFIAEINGLAVSDDYFVPVASDYERRRTEKFLYPIFDEMKHRIYYCTYDITRLLKLGENILTIQLGNGWYRQTERIAEGVTSYSDNLKAIYSIEIETQNGKVYIDSDGSEKYTDSEIVYNNLFIGEIINPNNTAKKEKDVKIVSNPDSELCKQIGIPDRIIKTVTPKCLAKIGKKCVFDVGENISGVVRILTSANAGEQIALRFAENINEDYTLDFATTGSDYVGDSGRPQIMCDIFVSDGSRRYFQPKFVWHGFRYFEVEGDIEEAEVLVIHSATPVTASFKSSSEGLNFLYNSFIRTQLNNMHGSFPSDCPHRERLGYTGDGQLCSTAAMMMLDCKEFYKKWIEDILDCQDRKSGHIQHTAPFMGGGGGPGGWGSAIVFVPYNYYKQFGDIEILNKCYLPMCKWIDYLTTRCENGLIVKEEENGWCLGDWGTLEPIEIPASFVNTICFIKILNLLCEISELLGKKDDERFKKLSNESICAVKKVFFNGEHFCKGVQGADAFAAWVGLTDKEILDKLSKKYNELGYFDTGILGTDILLEVLFENGYFDTALNLLESEKLGSFLYMKRKNATTIWEDWKGTCSHNHPMFGACARQIFSAVLGIKQNIGTAGYCDIEICPKIPRNLEYAKGSIKTLKGEIFVSWKRQVDGIKFEISVPQSLKAIFKHKGKEIKFKRQISIVL